MVRLLLVTLMVIGCLSQSVLGIVATSSPFRPVPILTAAPTESPTETPPVYEGVNEGGFYDNYFCRPTFRVGVLFDDRDRSGNVTVGDVFILVGIPSSENLRVDLTESFRTQVPGDPTMIGTFNWTQPQLGIMVEELSPSNNQTESPEEGPATCPAGQTLVRELRTNDQYITTTLPRGAGSAIDSCDSYGNDFPDRSGSLCYPECRDGFSGNGPLCLSNCPSGFRNDPLHCGKPSSYGRGAGRAPGIGCSGCSGCSWGGCSGCSSCNLNPCRQSEERNGGLCYPRCRAGFHAFGCCVCSPDCPEGMADIGVSCQKESYGRGVGRPLRCSAGEDFSDGLCYRQCGLDSYGVGPLCYRSCPPEFPHRFGIWCFADRNDVDINIVSVGFIGTLTLGIGAAVSVGIMEGIGQDQNTEYTIFSDTPSLALFRTNTVVEFYLTDSSDSTDQTTFIDGSLLPTTNEGFDELDFTRPVPR